MYMHCLASLAKKASESLENILMENHRNKGLRQSADCKTD